MSKNQLVDVFKWTGFVLLALAPFALFYVNAYQLFPFVTGKAFVWRSIVTILLFAWISAALLDPRFRFSWKHPLFLSVTVFIGVMTLATIFGDNPYRSFWSNAERMRGLVALLHLYAYFIAFIGFVRDRSHAHWIMAGLLVVGFISGLLGISQIGEKTRIDATLGNPIYLGAMSLLAIYISGYFFFLKESFVGFGQTTRKVFFGILALFFLWILFETGTRGALVGLGGGVIATAVAVLLLSKDPAEKVWRRISIVGLVLVAVFAGLFIFARQPLQDSSVVQAVPLLERTFSISLEDDNTVHRLENWKMGIEGFMDRPILGWGPESYITVFSRYYDPTELWDAEEWFDRSHNSYVDLLVFGGILGLASYAAIFVCLLYLLIRKGNQIDPLARSVLFGFVVAYLVQNIFAFDSLVSGIYLYSFFGFVAVLTATPIKNKKVTGKVFPLYITAPLIIAAGVGTVAWLQVGIYDHYRANREFITLLLPSNNIGPEERLDNVRSAFDRNTSFSQEFFEQGVTRLTSIAENENYGEEVRVAFIELYLNEGAELLENNPDNARIALFNGYAYYKLGLFEQAVPYLEIAVEYSPQKITNLLLLADALQKTGDDDYAIYVERAYELAPEDPEVEQAYENLRVSGQ